MTAVADALRGLKISPKEIANRSRLPLERVEAILSGENAALSEVRAIAAGLRVPLHLLARARPASEATSVRPLFRDTKKGQASYDLTVEKVASFIEAALEILPPRSGLPGWLQAIGAGERTYAEADRLAKQFRRMVFEDHEEQPASDLFLVLGSLEGVIVSRLDYSRYEGVSLVAGNYCFIFVSPRFAGRMLFTVGHELGHIVAHHQNGDRALFEEPSDIGSFGRHSQEESFVDAFSSCLLLPDVGVGKSLKLFRDHFGIESNNLTDMEILLLARFYGVSFEVAARRCEDLRLLPAGVGHSLATTLSKEFGSPEKRAESLGLPARPEVSFPPISANLAEHLSSKINLGEISIGWAADRLGVTIGEILAANVRPVEP
ncbi:ImmA/IrrE family metallo-endopeptidase [Sphingomonas sp. KR3-1]|uniref:ImmA/IrrE family metallo-endopeptidase n=1 Tax=Sphingomonas sp. KR3-1 TaxID=3156611 RepID=UPI0032B5C7EA